MKVCVNACEGVATSVERDKVVLKCLMCNSDMDLVLLEEMYLLTYHETAVSLLTYEKQCPD